MKSFILLLVMIPYSALAVVPVLEVEEIEKQSLIQEYCQQRQILAVNRDEGKVVCPLSKDSEYSKKDVLSLKVLNVGIQVRKEYALALGKTYTPDQIQSDMDKLFRIGDEEPWVIETEIIKIKLNKTGV